ncbi:phage portal protein [Lacticaseibacillus paracasei]|uniref:phage portal protein n=1 Tax=Lacticaseibacillus paracasei TaxID=1597 RepID=UPI0022E43EB6|nr:phage portal protein [Lacticaseibacillus paracasei]
MGLLTPKNFNKRKAKNMVYPSNPAFFTTTVGGMQLSYVSALSALQNTNVYSVINRIASDVASAHFKTENTATLNRLESPSGLIGRFSFWQGALMQLCLSGNDYIPLVGQNLEHIPNSDVQINYLPGNTGIIYTVLESNNRPQMVLRQDQMLHFRLMPDPQYRYLIGRSPLESLQNALNLDEKASKSNMSAMENQINPAGKLTISNYLSDGKDLESAREEFEKANTGDNSGRLMVLPDGFDYNQLEMKTDVFKALADNSAYSADQISKAFGVPSDILGGGTSTESQHSNIDQIKATYLANLNSYVNPIVDELRLKMNAPDLELDIKDMLDVDDSTLINQVSNLAKAGLLGAEQGQFMLTRSGFFPNNLPEFKPLATQVKGGDESDN